MRQRYRRTHQGSVKIAASPWVWTAPAGSPNVEPREPPEMSFQAIAASPGALLLAGWLLGCALLAASYWFAGWVWVERHSLNFRIGSRPARCSGAVGEGIIFGVCAGILYLVDLTTPAFTVSELIGQHGRAWLVALGVMAAV